ncbi:MAG: transketolase [Acidobacteria bacterium 13_1_40CM_65_14]|nr:MAG: transketolase [Acidobacteria bacterium 13_1_40CM_65_14]OLC78289.1 MAG: transketolase [Acidobacteria bacterium 13_1_40CM_4_65_8]
MPIDRASLIPALKNIATELRIDSIRSTSEAGSGHPTSCCSAAEIMAALFFAEMRFDPKDPRNPDADRFVLSKGHAAPVLYAAWAESGAFDRSELLKLRRIDSDLEGHPTPRLPFVDVATGSLGQGICAAIGIALNARRINSDYRTYVLLGDGESAEGSVWEAGNVGAADKLDNLCGITDVNGLGQSRATMWDHDMEQFARRWRAFGWHAIVVDGHELTAILDALDEARRTKGQPTMILAKTIKGKGISFAEGKEGWHGKALNKAELERAVAELEKQFVPVPGDDVENLAKNPAILIKKPTAAPRPAVTPKPVAPPSYKLGDQVATREAYGDAITKLGDADPRVVALDADVKNSTFSDKFEKKFPDRFYENFIAEQVMVGAAMGLAARGAIPFPSTFACFLSRAADFIRMAAISHVGVKLAGSHAGVSIGEDGPSQMALEDLAICAAEPNFTVLYPCDAVSAERLVALMAYHPGPAYMRTSRPKTPVIYSNDETFTIGGLKVLRESGDDVATVIGAGVTVFEALKAHDELKSSGMPIRVIDLYSVSPIDRDGLVAAARATGGHLITVEDHYPVGGIGDAVAAAVADAGFTVHRLAVREIPRSGKPEELLDRFGISATHIVSAVRAVAGKPVGAPR